ncbi:adenosine deaminase CECR1-A [Podospora fimiseda]|uniref:Adenosine deaminase CECR1-A n=1 Tax=Podospora fimiseda TaxID=252190 RepID=A0AAN7BKQ6_9PEZI|nr:adenosine deaminase CECR1-A [Podospora fimiseda]
MPPLADEDYADLLTHEIPSFDDPVIQKYLSSKQALILEEKKHFSDHSFRQALSPLAKKACAIFDSLLSKEKEIPEPKDTKSYTILQLLPKGGLLNCHLHDLIDFTELAELVIGTRGLFISSTTAQDGKGVSIKFFAKSREEKEGWVRIDEAAKKFRQDDGVAGFLPWLRGLFFGGGEERSDGGSEEEEKDSAEMDSNSGEKILREVLYYEPIFRRALRRVFELMVLDGVLWGELRMTFPIQFYRENSETPEDENDYDYLFKVIREEVDKFRAGLISDQVFWGVRIIWSTTSEGVVDQRGLIQDMDDCITTKISHPDLVAGYDPSMVLARASKEGWIIPCLFWFRKQCAQEDVQIPFLCGSVESDDNLFDTLLLGARRVWIKGGEEGRRIVMNNPKFLEAVKDKKILVGVEPAAIVPVWRRGRNSSITEANTVGTISGLVAQGVCCAVGVGQERQLSRELWMMMMNGNKGEGGVDLATLGCMAENSVRWGVFEDLDGGSWTKEIREASVGDGTKAERLRKWAVEWERFCLCVVHEFGDEEEDVEVGGDD